jgi:hypothetical protein
MPPEPCALCGSTQGPDHICPGRAAELIGTTLDGRYLIEDVLGMGGMGMVYRGLQSSVKRPVAIKTLHAALASAPEFFERFKREAETASKLIHPNIITIYDFGRTSTGLCYYVMELLTGQSLKQLVKEGGALSLHRATDIIEQAAKGLGYAHHENVIHRDIKPHNIMVQNLDGADLTKVLDFGLVKAMEHEEGEQLTSTGQVLGTPQYMPPEQASGEPVDQRSDLFSLTGVLYYSLTGTSPWGANTIRKALMAPLQEELPTATSRRPGAPLPEEVEEFFRKGLAAEKEDRFQSAEEFIDAMHDAVSGVDDARWEARPTGPAPDAAGGGSSSSRVGKRARGRTPSSRNKDPAASGVARWVVGGAAALAVAGGIGYFATRPREPAPLPPPLLVKTPDPPPPVRPVESEVVTVRLRTMPKGADVMEGQLQLGTTPVDLRLPRGALHVLSFQLKGYSTVQKALDLSHIAGDSTELAVTLDATADKQHRRKRDDVPIFDDP